MIIYTKISLVQQIHWYSGWGGVEANSYQKAQNL